MRFCRQVIDEYPEPNRSRLLDVLDNSWDDNMLTKEFYDSLKVVEHMDGYQVSYLIPSLFGGSYKVALFAYSEHLFIDDEQKLPQTVVKFLEYTSEPLPGEVTGPVSSTLGV